MIGCHDWPPHQPVQTGHMGNTYSKWQQAAFSCTAIKYMPLTAPLRSRGLRLALQSVTVCRVEQAEYSRRTGGAGAEVNFAPGSSES
jgi:hypothetical protein